MSLFDGLKESLVMVKDAQTLPVVRERLALVQDKLAAIEKQLVALEAENSDLLRENRELRKQLESAQKEDEYLDLGCCFLKRNPTGGYFKNPLCPSCKKPFSDMAGRYACGSCGVLTACVPINNAVRDALKG